MAATVPPFSGRRSLMTSLLLLDTNVTKSLSRAPIAISAEGLTLLVGDLHRLFLFGAGKRRTLLARR